MGISISRLGTEVAHPGDIAGEARQRIKGLVREGKKQISSFTKSVQEKRQLERQQPGWQSAAFDF